ncbi:MAG: hypothetical protein K0R50_245 [Eubacterium sp.]|jgi:hypothetical protein|nr:hypothetical protein [Eubacterium sp.]
MPSVQLDKFNKFDSDLNKLLNELPEARRKLDERISKIAQEATESKISVLGSNDSTEAISNYVDSGHRIREPTEDSKTYGTPTDRLYADESNLYQEASTALEAKAIAEVEQFAEDIRKKLEG